MLLALSNTHPFVHPSAFVAPSADLIGAVTVEEEASVWFQAVLRADQNQIIIARRANVQDGVVIHCDPPDLGGSPAGIGEGVTVGHGARLHGCRIGAGSLIGISATVLDGARIGELCIVAPGAVVLAGQEVPPRSVVAGVPARIKRSVSDEDLRRMSLASDTYLRLARSYREQIGTRKGAD
jgi:carbonic anhydrase/acetyltransferase-like protein (isoleucine patch superfamily)